MLGFKESCAGNWEDSAVLNEFIDTYEKLGANQLQYTQLKEIAVLPTDYEKLKYCLICANIAFILPTENGQTMVTDNKYLKNVTVRVKRVGVEVTFTDYKMKSLGE